MDQSNEKPKKSERLPEEMRKINERLVQQSALQAGNDRAKQRKRESDHYQNVIVKRNDETFRHADDILQLAIHEGKSQIERPAWGLFMSSVAAGMIIGFTVIAVGVMASILGDLSGMNRVLVALVYPLGFVLCILSRTELFTEHTATAVYPLLEGLTTVKKVLLLWTTVIVGNLCGALLISALLAKD